jgi:hypothetical protein
VLLARGLASADAGVPSHRDGRSRPSGRRPGYDQDVLGRLGALADAATAHGLTARWS